MSISLYKRLLFKLIKENWIDILLAVLFIFISYKLFAIFLFIEIIFQINKAQDYLRKITRVIQVESDMRVITIVKKLGIISDEISENTEKYYNNLSKSAWDKYVRDYEDITGLILDRDETKSIHKK